MWCIHHFLFLILLVALCISVITGYGYVWTSSSIVAATCRAQPYRFPQLLFVQANIDTAVISNVSNVVPSEIGYHYKLRSDSKLRALKFIHFIRKYESVLQKQSMQKKLSMSQTTLDHWKKVVQRSIVIERIIERSNLHLVHMSASRYQAMGLSVDELIKVGRKGLQTAIGKYYDYDMGRGSSFSSFAYRFINRYVRNALSIRRSLPKSMPHNVMKLLTVVKTAQAHLQAQRGMPPTSEELRLEMGVTPAQFDVVRRAIAFARRSSSSSEDRRDGTSGVHYDESTWEKVVSPYDELDRVDAVESTLGDKTRSVSYQSDAFNNILSILHTLPKDEAAAIYQRLELAAFDSFDGTMRHPIESRGRKTLTLLFQGQLFRMSGKEAAALYQRGMHRLRRRVALSMLCRAAKY